MKPLKFEKGYHVNDWDGAITEVYFKPIKRLHFGSLETVFLVLNLEGVLIDTFYEYQQGQLFTSLIEAKDYSKGVITDRIKRYTNEIEDAKRHILQLKKI